MTYRSILFAALGAGFLIAAAAAPAQAAWGRGPGWHGGWHGGGWHVGWRGPGWGHRGWYGPRAWGPGVYVAPPVIYPAPGVAIVP